MASRSTTPGIYIQDLPSNRQRVDEAYAMPVDYDLLARYCREELSPQAATLVRDQIGGFNSWRDAFLQVASEQCRDAGALNPDA